MELAPADKAASGNFYELTRPQIKHELTIRRGVGDPLRQLRARLADDPPCVTGHARALTEDFPSLAGMLNGIFLGLERSDNRLAGWWGWTTRLEGQFDEFNGLITHAGSRCRAERRPDHRSPCATAPGT